MTRAPWIIGLIVATLTVTLWACQPRATTPTSTVFGTTQAPPPPPVSTGAATVAPSTGTLEGKVYLLAEGTAALPDFSQLRPIGSVYTSQLNIPARKFSDGFPGLTDRFEWFAIDYQGSCQFNPGGIWTFRAISDDGIKVYIDGNLVLENDFIHGPSEKIGQANISQGTHKVRISYFQGPREEIALQLYAQAPGGNESIFTCR